jgi:hypothetical protein
MLLIGGITLLCEFDLRDGKGWNDNGSKAFVPVQVSEDERRGDPICCAVDGLLSWSCCASYSPLFDKVCCSNVSSLMPSCLSTLMQRFALDCC